MTPTSIDSPRAPREVPRTWLSRRAAGWSAAFLITLFAFYRLATFVPQPLDGPHTLRPILNAWFDAFLRHYEHPESAYENWRALCLLGLLTAPALAVLNFLRESDALRLPPRAARILCSRALFLAALAATLLLCRYPTLVDYQLNPDEGEFLSAAHKLFYNANYFDSVDCGTSGPLNIYPLMLPAIFGFSPDYASSRMLVLLAALCGIWLFYRTVRLLAPDSLARLAVLPLAGALAVFEHPNLVHYSSEQIPVLLVSLALYLAVRVLRDPAAHRLPLFLLGFLASAAFFSKMQSLPIVGMIGLVAAAFTYAAKSARRLAEPVLLFVAGMLPLQLLNAAMCLAAGVWTNFWISYIVSNQRYADLGSNFVAEMPRLVTFFTETPEVAYFLFSFLALGAAYTLARLRTFPAADRGGLWQMALAGALVIGALMAALLHAATPDIAAYLLLIAIATAPLCSLLIFEKGAFGVDPVRWFGLLSAAAACAAVFSVYRPHRPFPHYLFFLFLPVAAVMAWMLLRQARDSAPSARLAFPLLFAALAVSQPVFLWGSRDPHGFRTTAATIRQPEGDFIRSLTSPHGQIFVWGWTPDPYLGSGRVTATRDLNLFYQFLAPQDITSYYRDRLLHDLSRNPPELIVDAIGTDSWSFEDNGIYGLAQVPEIARFVGDFYRHVADGYGMHFFLRADLMSRAASLALPEACPPNALRCLSSPRRFYPEGVTTPVMDDSPPVKMPEHARIDVEFTPFGRQTENSTILNNEGAPRSFHGFRFQNVSGDLYRLEVGLGDRWEYSKPVLLPDGKPVRLSLEFAPREVRIRANGAQIDDLHLSAPLADSPGPVTVGAWINGMCRFSGTFRYFQLLDLHN